MLTEEQKEVIYKNKVFIDGLKQVEALYYTTLIEEMGYNENGNDAMFDFLFNFEKHNDFEKYCIDHGYDMNDFIGWV